VNEHRAPLLSIFGSLGGSNKTTSQTRKIELLFFFSQKEIFSHVRICLSVCDSAIGFYSSSILVRMITVFVVLSSLLQSTIGALLMQADFDSSPKCCCLSTCKISLDSVNRTYIGILSEYEEFLFTHADFNVFFFFGSATNQLGFGFLHAQLVVITPSSSSPFVLPNCPGIRC
jgi:hypothetical protein